MRAEFDRAAYCRLTMKSPRDGGFSFTGGEGGIRTLGALTRTPDFESGTIDHSATSPKLKNPTKAVVLRRAAIVLGWRFRPGRTNRPRFYTSTRPFIILSIVPNFRPEQPKP